MIADESATVTVGLVGYGYWGPNLARNFARQPGCTLAAICDTDPARRAAAAKFHPHTLITGDYEDLLRDERIQAIAVATPVSYHHGLTRRALLAGKDVLVEKPLAGSVAEAEELVDLAERQGRLMAVDHTFLFTGAVRLIADLVKRGEIGDLVYVDSVRINLGLFQHDVNVVWDLAPHDLSIIAHVTGMFPDSVQAMGMRYGSDTLESIAYTHMEFAGGPVAHCHFNWVSPVKVRRMLIVGTEKMIVYDDMEASEKVKVYDKRVIPSIDRAAYNEVRVDYRTGDMWAPKIDLREALDLEAEHFLDCVRNRTNPLADGRFGLEITRQLEWIQQSLDQGAVVRRGGAA